MTGVHSIRETFCTIINNIEIQLIKYGHFSSVSKNFTICNYSIKICADYKGEMTFTLSFKIHSIFGRKYYFLEIFSHNKLLHNYIYRQFLILLFTSNIY